MSDPVVICTNCRLARNCMKHLRAEHPPTAAKRWLKRRCPIPDRCDFTYRAGLMVGGPATGQ